MHVDNLVAANHGFEEVFGATYYVGCRINYLNFDCGGRGRDVQRWVLLGSRRVIGHGAECVDQA